MQKLHTHTECGLRFLPLLHTSYTIGLSSSPGRWRCFLRLLCPVRKPLTALDCVLLKERNLGLVPRQCPENSSWACLWSSPRPTSQYTSQFFTTILKILFKIIFLLRPIPHKRPNLCTCHEQSLCVIFLYPLWRQRAPTWGGSGVIQNTIVLYPTLLCWRRHVSATVGHLVTKMCMEENYAVYDHSIGAYSKLWKRSRYHLVCPYWATSTSSK